jgi:hypothetical protein
MKAIHISARRWNDRNGNTYHTARVYADGVQVASVPFTYGYGSHYETTAEEAMRANGLLSDKDERQALWNYCREHGIAFVSDVVDVTRRRDLHA